MQAFRQTEAHKLLHLYTHIHRLFPFLFQSHSQNFLPGSSQTQRQWTAATVSLRLSSWMFGGSAKLVLKTVCKCLTLRPKEISEPNQILRKICALGQNEQLTIQVLEEQASIHVSIIGSEYIYAGGGFLFRPEFLKFS